MPDLLRLMIGPGRLRHGLLGLLGLGWLAACQPQADRAETATTPPVGHYEGGIGAAGQPELRAALDIRHPSPGHYEAELTVPLAGTLNFVADTILFSNNELRLTRPAHPAQTLHLTLEGDFWRGTLALDSVKIATILVKRGVPTPSTYRVEELPQASGSAWLFAPSDTGTAGAALALLPTSATASATALWADALAREGIIVLVLPVADSATAATETPRLQAALRLLRGTAGADTANVGIWAVGARAAATAAAVAAPGGPRATFIIAQNTDLDPATKAAFRELRNRKMPVLGLYGGPAATQKAALLRNLLGGRRSQAVARAYRGAGADLLVPGGLSRGFGPGLPGEVVEWLRGK
jgi:hypothetical protein